MKNRPQVLAKFYYRASVFRCALDAPLESPTDLGSFFVAHSFCATEAALAGFLKRPFNVEGQHLK
ncbi:MAG TPA: hypothetical protein DHV51_03180 [Opitutae bacterium]|nr:hypothetical protein [Opitutae bacterium]